MTPADFMYRCLELARKGAGYVAPNPMVGAVLVHEGRVIGEGYHAIYGQAHAEVNCINSVNEADRGLIPKSVLYVSLEPCAHFGKTPPCADLIIRHKIPKVIIGCRDPFDQVDGKGIEKLKAAGIEVETNLLEKECKDLNKRFFTFHTQARPYIVLKWTQTRDEKIASADNTRLLISNEYSNRLVHKWRTEEASILVGTNTALLDDPLLTNRLWEGPSPVRLVLDKYLRLPDSLKLFNNDARTIVFNIKKQAEEDNISYYQLRADSSFVHQVAHALYRLKIQSVLVEGGAKLLQSFIDHQLWDEARVITNTKLEAGEGLAAPVLGKAITIGEMNIENDRIDIYKQVN